MNEATARRLEAIVDLSASAALAAALVWAGTTIGGNMIGGVAGVAGGWASWAALRRLGSEAKTYAVRIFDVRDLEIDPVDELVLSDADRWVDNQDHELLLDDVLPVADPGSRVVRLFDAAAMPTPGELMARIDRHLASPQPAPPDASQALFEALADLRSSLR